MKEEKYNENAAGGREAEAAAEKKAKARTKPKAEAKAKKANAKPSRLPLALSLQFADPRHRALLPRHRVARWLRAALGDRPAEITVRVVDAEEGQGLNREFRGKDYATNILTFDYARKPAVMADLVLCAPVVEAEAAAQGKALEAHYAHLVVHGALHALGFDHEVDADAEAMEARESELLRALGFADPHASRPTD